MNAEVDAIWEAHQRECAVCHYTTEGPCSIAVMKAEIDQLRDRLRDRSAYLDWLVLKVCPNHNLECLQVGCPATPPEWRPNERM